jgi:hypothetical protein
VPDGPVVRTWKYDLQSLPKECYFAGRDRNIYITIADIDCNGYSCSSKFNNPIENR